ncbi:FAD:protein FMN transferase [Alteromonas sp. ASW11-36]|uniref:FAD:protein FMN transferase n=1 Tax=Alteromonas arenosi TaxID=3055817 RepID=A0ABT7SZ63_9ALTE|nr:FAD:protein FMN transferase [Alteromonas sp. ASW11-36]MDM7861478.1 FAD:protein FMN transferase [Alteromonas sp. ASW11-36]
MNQVKYLIVGVSLLFLLFGCAPQQPQEVHLQGATMGTSYNVKFAPSENVDPEDIHRQIDAALIRVNALMSTYDPNSELSKLNQHRSAEPFALSPETVAVLREAVRLHQVSDGALDITIGPVVNLWGFGPTQRPDVVPSDALIAETLATTGIDKIVLADNSIIKNEPNLYIDLSTIAKGYGVDVIAELLIAAGITEYLVEIGGEMRVAGNKMSGQPWRIAIEKPVSTERAVQSVIEIGNNAIATSGDYRNYYEQDGVRYSHLINPITGKPIQHNLVSVSVIHPSAMTADGLATALIVMGTEQAKAVAELNNIAVILISKSGNEFIQWTSSTFDQRVNVVTPHQIGN